MTPVGRDGLGRLGSDGLTRSSVTGEEAVEGGGRRPDLEISIPPRRIWLAFEYDGFFVRITRWPGTNSSSRTKGPAPTGATSGPCPPGLRSATSVMSLRTGRGVDTPLPAVCSPGGAAPNVARHVDDPGQVRKSRGERRAGGAGHVPLDGELEPRPRRGGCHRRTRARPGARRPVCASTIVAAVATQARTRRRQSAGAGRRRPPSPGGKVPTRGS